MKKNDKVRLLGKPDKEANSPAEMRDFVRHAPTIGIIDHIADDGMLLVRVEPLDYFWFTPDAVEVCN